LAAAAMQCWLLSDQPDQSNYLADAFVYTSFACSLEHTLLKGATLYTVYVRYFAVR